MTLANHVLLLVISLVSACTTSARMPLPLCDDELAFAERDLSGDVVFNEQQVVYRTKDGALCKS